MIYLDATNWHRLEGAAGEIFWKPDFGPVRAVGCLPTTLSFVTVAEVTFRYDFNTPVQRAPRFRVFLTLTDPQLR